METLGPFNFAFEAYSNILILGSSGSGKSRTTMDILLNRNRLFTKPVDLCIYFYQCEQSLIEDVKNLDPSIHFVNSKTDLEDLLAQEEYSHACITFDDYYVDTLFTDQRYIIDWFTKRSHHNKCSLLYTSQMLPPKRLHVLTLNTHYFLLKKNFYESQFMYFFRALNSNQWRFLWESYLNVVNKQAYSTFVISNHPKTNPLIRIRGFVLPSVGEIVYIPKT